MVLLSLTFRAGLRNIERSPSLFVDYIYRNLRMDLHRYTSPHSLFLLVLKQYATARRTVDKITGCNDFCERYNDA